MHGAASAAPRGTRGGRNDVWDDSAPGPGWARRDVDGASSRAVEGSIARDAHHGAFHTLAARLVRAGDRARWSWTWRRAATVRERAGRDGRFARAMAERIIMFQRHRNAHSNIPTSTSGCGVGGKGAPRAF